MNKAYILLGANLLDPVRQLKDARHMIQKEIGTILLFSSIYESQAWGVEDQPSFFNQVLLIDTPLSPELLLNQCQHIENALGRVRKEKWGARIIDIDILYFNNETIQSQHLTVPHPLLHERKFTLIPLVEIAHEYIHPIFNKKNSELLLACKDPLAVSKTDHTSWNIR